MFPPIRLFLLAPLLFACKAKSEGDSGEVGSGWGGPSTATSESGAFTLRYSSDPDPLPYNEPFNLQWEVVEGAGATGLTVTAEMPEHNHGMNTTPATSPDGEGFVTTGMLFHMPGEWEIYADVTSPEGTDRVVFPFNCCETF